MGSRHFSQEQKLSILNSAAEIGVKQAAELAGVHYTSVYDWRRQLKSLDKQGFLDYNPSYPGRGINQITPGQEKAVLDVWHNSPGFDPGQVRNRLRPQAITISIRTVRFIMQANGYKAAKKKSAKKELQRFEARRPLELAQMDVLEFFINKLKVHLLLLLDDFSRFILGWQLLTETSTDAVGSKGSAEFLSGTGKYEGISGGGTNEDVGSFPSARPGTFQGCSPAIGTFKLP